MFWWIVVSTPFLLLIIALCLPLTLNLSLTSQPDLMVEARAQWALWRSQPFRFAPLSSATPTSSAPLIAKRSPSPSVATEAAAAPQRLASKPAVEDSGQKREQLSGVAIYRLLKKYFPRIWRALHWRCLRGEIYLAVNDPSTYGWIWAFLGATNWPPPPLRMQVELAHQLAFQVDAQWRMRLYPIQWLGLALSIAWEPVVRPLWQSKLRRKGESKRAKSQSVHRTAGKPNIQQDGNRRSYYSG